VQAPAAHLAVARKRVQVEGVPPAGLLALHEVMMRLAVRANQGRTDGIRPPRDPTFG
jgi:hypothetical protein